jgi:hypothetical protein
MFARRQWAFALVAVLLFLTGGVILGWLRITHEADRADELAAEADLRGTAVSTLAGDVRVLRAQIQAKGGTPAAPDPAKAVEHLPDRAEVPVPIPGPPGPKGDKGDPAPIITPSPGPTGATGRPGINSTIPGPAGPAGIAGPAGQNGADGKPGQDGTNGRDGAAGSPPAGWTYTDPAGVAYTCSPVANFDPAAPRYTCAADSTAPPSPSPAGRGTLGLIALSGTAAYRRLQWSTNAPPQDRTPGRPVTTSQML